MTDSSTREDVIFFFTPLRDMLSHDWNMAKRNSNINLNFIINANGLYKDNFFQMASTLYCLASGFLWIIVLNLHQFQSNY
jgi:hypothetical protein